MDAVINLRHEPKLREAFEYAHVHNNTVLVDRRTRWGNPFRVGRDGSPDEVVARYRANLWRRIRAGRSRWRISPHRAAHWCPPSCGCHRRRLRQRAAHDCLRLPPHRPPLKRRGGSDPPGSPASISRSPVQHESGF